MTMIKRRLVRLRPVVFAVAAVTLGASAAAIALQAPPRTRLVPVWSIEATPVAKLELQRPAAGRPGTYIRDAGRMSDGTLLLSMNGALHAYGADGTPVRSTSVTPQNRSSIGSFYILSGDTIIAESSHDLVRYFSANLDSLSAVPRKTHTEQEYLLPNGTWLGFNPHVGASTRWHNPYDLFLLQSDSWDNRVYLGSIAPPASIAFRRTPFTVHVSFASTRNSILVGYGMEPLIRVFTLDGRRMSDIRLNRSTRAVTSADVAAFWEIPSNKPDPGWPMHDVAGNIKDVVYGVHHPYYERIAADADGNVWVEDYRMDKTQPALWRVLTVAGEEVATIELPSGFGPTQIDRDFITGMDWSSGQARAAFTYRIRR